VSEHTDAQEYRRLTTLLEDSLDARGAINHRTRDMGVAAMIGHAFHLWDKDREEQDAKLRIREVHKAQDDREGAGKFVRFHAQYPGVYDRIVEIARALRLNGHLRFGMKAIFERLRWAGGPRTAGLSKLDNSYTSHYARLIVATESGLSEFFEVRGGGDATAAEVSALGQLPLDLG